MQNMKILLIVIGGAMLGFGVIGSIMMAQNGMC